MWGKYDNYTVSVCGTKAKLSVHVVEWQQKQVKQVCLENHVFRTTCWRTIFMTIISMAMITSPVHIRPEKFLADIPEETFPRWEVRSLEQSVFQNSLDTTKCLDHVSSVVVQVPQFAVMSLVCPPERILLQNLTAPTHKS